MVYFKQLGKSRDARSLIKELVDRIGKLEDKVNEIETLDFTQVIRSNNDSIVYVTAGSIEPNAIVTDPNLRLYQMPFEPDGIVLNAWIRFLSSSSSSGGGGTSGYKDDSGFGNIAPIFSGSPTPAAGPVTGMPSLQFNGIDDCLHIPDAPTINMTGTLTYGITVSFNVNPTAVTTSGNRPRIIACKVDDSITNPSYAWSIWVEPDSTLYFHVRYAGILKTAAKTFAFPSLNRWYRVFCTFDRQANNTPQIYINAVASTDTVSTYVGSMRLSTSSKSLFIGSNDISGESFFSGFISDFRYWREKVVNQTEISSIQANSYSISPITNVGRVGVGNFLPTDDQTAPPPPGTPPPIPPPPPPPPPPTPGVTLKSFSNTSYTTESYMTV